MCVCIYEEIDYKELAPVAMRLASPNLECGLAGWRPGRADSANGVQRQCAASSLGRLWGHPHLVASFAHSSWE